MDKITPYNNLTEALETLDNGGRFYNILTKEDDGVISQAELGRVSGLFNDKQKMVLFLELSLSKLDPEARAEIESSLDKDLQATFQKYKPQFLLPAEANDKGEVSKNAIITGIPTLVDSKSELNGFIMVPVVTSVVTTFIMVPLTDKYDVYELRDKATDTQFLIAHARGEQKLPKKKIKVAGVLKELKANKTEEKASRKYLEALYHLEID